MTFANPGYLFLLLLLAPVIFWYVWELHKSDASLQIASTDVLRKQPRTARLYMLHLPFVLRCAVIILLTVCLARPQLSNRWSKESTEGIDIMMAMDISGTMLAEDLKPNRLEAAKQVATEFISDRPNDNIGLVVFAGESFTQCPLTTDHAVLINLFRSVKFGMIDDGTAIGLGLANAVNRMKDSPTKSKVIILLTDGVNNQGSMDPMSAAEIAALYKIRLYTIGVGSLGKAPYPFRDQFGRVHYQNIDVEIDEQLMQNMAAATGDGRYFRATNRKALAEIFSQIDDMEKSRIDVTQYAQTRDEQEPWLWLAFIALLLEVLVRWGWFKV